MTLPAAEPCGAFLGSPAAFGDRRVVVLFLLAGFFERPDCADLLRLLNRAMGLSQLELTSVDEHLSSRVLTLRQCFCRIHSRISARKDPHERTNLAAKNGARVRHLQKSIEGWVANR